MPELIVTARRGKPRLAALATRARASRARVPAPSTQRPTAGAGHPSRSAYDYQPTTPPIPNSRDDIVLVPYFCQADADPACPSMRNARPPSGRGVTGPAFHTPASQRHRPRTPASYHIPASTLYLIEHLF
jgi:hypothetical protein